MCGVEDLRFFDLEGWEEAADSAGSDAGNGSESGRGAIV
jgi:hypothetical protein